MSAAAARPDPTPSVGADAFKAAMRGLAAGVTVVTSRHGAEMNGMTATAVCSVSADPPLALVVVNRSSASHALISKGRAFALNILSERQGDVARYFGGSDAKSFELTPHRLGLSGCPVLEGCAATLECVVHSASETGTHTIFVGRVIDAASGGLPPIVFHDGSFQGLAPLAD